MIQDIEKFKELKKYALLYAEGSGEALFRSQAPLSIPDSVMQAKKVGVLIVELPSQRYEALGLSEEVEEEL